MDYDALIDNIKLRCKELNVPVTTACEEAKVGKNFVSNIKSGSTPSVEKVQMLAEYLGVSTSELLGEPVITPGSELEEYLEELRTRPEKRLLFHVTKGATKEQIEAIAKFIEGLENK